MVEIVAAVGAVVAIAAVAESGTGAFRGTFADTIGGFVDGLWCAEGCKERNGGEQGI